MEKVPGGMLEESHVLDGVMLNKDVVHPGMRRRIENPRILLLDCPLEYKKAESQTNLELNKESDFEAVLRQEEDFIKNLCDSIIKHRPDIVCTEKGVADLTQHYLAKAGISVLRRLRKTDNNRIARATGATICNVPEEIKEEDIGTRCGLFEVRKISDEYFAFMEKCTEPKACTILLRGASKDVLNEIERNLLDAMSVVRNIVFDPRIVPGGGATEMAIATVSRQAHGADLFCVFSLFFFFFFFSLLFACGCTFPSLSCFPFFFLCPDENLSCASYEAFVAM